MNRYSKIKIFGASKSRSMDFSDLSLAFPAPAKSNANTFLQPQETSKNIIGTDSTAHDSLSVLQEDEENNVEGSFRMKLGRSSSVSSSSVKKAFSMRKSNANTFLQPQETSKNIIGTDSTARDSLSVLQEDEDNNVEESSRMKLGRSSSVSSSSVKKAFSMRRSSSVSERYCRIYDQPVTLSSPIRDEDGSLDTMESTRSVKKKHGRGRILKACKKLFGL